jgi:hypothetical protein
VIGMGKEIRKRGYLGLFFCVYCLSFLFLLTFLSLYLLSHFSLSLSFFLGLFEALSAELQASDPVVHRSPLHPPQVDKHVHITIVQPGFVKTSIRENSLGPKGQGRREEGREREREEEREREREGRAR